MAKHLRAGIHAFKAERQVRTVERARRKRADASVFKSLCGTAMLAMLKQSQLRSRKQLAGTRAVEYSRTTKLRVALRAFKQERVRMRRRTTFWKRTVKAVLDKKDNEEWIRRSQVKARTTQTRKLFLLVDKYRNLHPPFYKLKRPAIPPGASIGTVAGVFLTPVLIALLAKLAGWTNIAVLMSFFLPLFGIVCGLYTPFPIPAPPPAQIVSTKVNLGQRLFKVLMIGMNALGKGVKALQACVGFCGKKLMEGLDCLLCGKFQEALAIFTQVGPMMICAMAGALVAPT